MVVLVGVLLSLLQSPLRVVVLVLHAFVDRERWHADTGQGEVVRTVVFTGFRMRIRTNSQTEFLGHGFNSGIVTRPFRAGDLDFFRLAERGNIIEIQVEGNLSRGNGRMFAKVFRSQKSLLLCRDRSEDDGSPRPSRSLR